MHEEPDEVQETPDLHLAATDVMSESGKVSESLLGRLRTRQEEAGQQVTVDMDLPYYEGELFARYHLLDGKRLQVITERAQRTEKNTADRAIVAAVDTLISACEEIFIRDMDEADEEGKGKEIPLREVMGVESPVRYDDLLAEFMNLQVEPSSPARSVVYQVFGKNDVAIANHNLRLSRWMSDPSRDPASGLLGELT